MWRGSEAARRNHDEQGDCAMHRAERDGEYPRTIGERKQSLRPVNRRNGSEGSVRSSPCRHATSRLTVHCRQACHRSNAGPRRIPCWRFFVLYMICEHNGSVRRCDVRSDSDERQPRLCAAAVRDTRRTHSADGHLKRALEREVCKARLFARHANPINSIPKHCVSRILRRVS